LQSTRRERAATTWNNGESILPSKEKDSGTPKYGRFDTKTLFDAMHLPRSPLAVLGFALAINSDHTLDLLALVHLPWIINICQHLDFYDIYNISVSHLQPINCWNDSWVHYIWLFVNLNLLSSRVAGLRRLLGPSTSPKENVIEF
jgi:hypothetical protein